MRPFNRKAKLGQGMTEYIIIVALIAITSIGMVRIFGDSVKYQIGKVVGAFTHQDADMDRPEISNTAKKRRNMGDFAKTDDR